MKNSFALITLLAATQIEATKGPRQQQQQQQPDLETGLSQEAQKNLTRPNTTIKREKPEQKVSKRTAMICYAGAIFGTHILVRLLLESQREN